MKVQKELQFYSKSRSKKSFRNHIVKCYIIVWYSEILSKKSDLSSSYFLQIFLMWTSNGSRVLNQTIFLARINHRVNYFPFYANSKLKFLKDCLFLSFDMRRSLYEMINEIILKNYDEIKRVKSIWKKSFN